MNPHSVVIITMIITIVTRNKNKESIPAVRWNCKELTPVQLCKRRVKKAQGHAARSLLFPKPFRAQVL